MFVFQTDNAILNGYVLAGVQLLEKKAKLQPRAQDFARHLYFKEANFCNRPEAIMRSVAITF